ncbi:MAG: hypothetical protein KDD38_02725 [Bdellovibrionales bacterium]|nr:hypothetical protein [Bdellovibrionales bacterium]
MNKSKIALKWNIFLLSLSLPQQTHADVNMKEASYFRTWIDHVIKRDRRDLKVRRTYKSRSLFQGVFGFGWCSDLDTNIDIKESESIELNDCHNKNALRFIKNKLTGNFTNTDNARDLIIFDGKTYSRRIHGALDQRFSPSGKLIINKNFIQKVEYTTDGLVREILYADQSAFQYRYLNKNLIEVIRAGRPHQQYEYDNLHNLTTIQYSNGEIERIQYDSDYDRVAFIKTRSGCTETYDFKLPDPSNRNHFVSSVIKKCPKLPDFKTQYEFWYEFNSLAQLYLDRVKIYSGANETEISYSSENGMATKVQTAQPSRTAAFENYIKGKYHEIYNPETQTTH